MNDIQVIEQFRHLIAEFKENQKQFGLAIVNGNYNNPVFEAIDKVVIEIKEKLAEYDVLRVDDLTLRNELIAIRENKDFAYFEVLKVVQRYVSEGKVDRLTFQPDWEEFYRTRWDDILQGEILSQVDPHRLVIRKMDLGALLVGKAVPEHLRAHLGYIKECYAWGFGNEASIYCRTILEEGFREALKSKPEFRTPQGKTDLENRPLAWLLNHSQQNRYFYKEAIDRAIRIKDNVKKLIHPTSAKDPRTPLSNIEIIKDTFYVMEMLFR
jgi:hypothetical protein